MKLVSMSISELSSYEEAYDNTKSHLTQYKGNVHYKGKNGTVQIPLTHEIASKILVIVSADMVKATKEIATSLTTEVYTQAALGAPQVELVDAKNDGNDGIPF